MTRHYGDFQTPPDLADLIVAAAVSKFPFSRVLEPTCGIGNFISSVLKCSPMLQEVVGVELQPEHWASAAERFATDPRVRIIQGDALHLDFSKDVRWEGSGALLVVGNLPWVTNAALGRLGGANLPIKRNLKKLSGMAALTGAANFDIAESILIRLLSDLVDHPVTFRLLCKSAVARSFLAYANNKRIPVRDCEIRMIDARKWFGAAVDACLLSFTAGEPANYRVRVYRDLKALVPASELIARDGELVRPDNTQLGQNRKSLQSGVVWRQGIKHDAARVMEITISNGAIKNGLDEVVDVEERFLYPLAKGSDLFHGRVASKHVIVTQSKIGEDTWHLLDDAPRLWAYLSAHSDAFDRRRSRIYDGQPPFSIFGIGPYSFSNYKVAISGLHKEARFRLIGPVANKPVMFDDTCYFAGFDSATSAAAVWSLLDSTSCQYWIDSLAFWDSKRPITKKLLSKIDLWSLVEKEDPGQARAVANHALASAQVHQRILTDAEFVGLVRTAIESNLPLPLFS